MVTDSVGSGVGVGVAVGGALVVVGDADGDDDVFVGVGVGVWVSAANAAGALPPTRTTPVPRPMTSGFRTDRASTSPQPPHRIAGDASPGFTPRVR
jgi:hypothetical protein